MPGHAPTTTPSPEELSTEGIATLALQACTATARTPAHHGSPAAVAPGKGQPCLQTEK